MLDFNCVKAVRFVSALGSKVRETPNKGVLRSLGNADRTTQKLAAVLQRAKY
jgi:hypothetical protein